MFSHNLPLSDICCYILFILQSASLTVNVAFSFSGLDGLTCVSCLILSYLDQV